MEEIELSNDELSNITCHLDGNPKIGWFCNKNGLLIKTYGWLVQNAIGIILLIHGFKAHARLTYMNINIKIPDNGGDLVVDSDNYYVYKDSWIEKFNQHGYSVYTLDLQGHGESQSLGNLRGDINCFDDLVDDVIQYMNQIYDEISNDIQADYEISSDIQTDYEIPNDIQTDYEITNDIQADYEISSDIQTDYEISSDIQTDYEMSSDNQMDYEIPNDIQADYEISSDNQMDYEIPNDIQADYEISSDNQTDDESHDIVTTKKKSLPMYIIGHSMGGNIALRILELLGKEKEDSINAGNKNNYKKFNIILDNYIDTSEIYNDMEEDMIDDVYDMNNMDFLGHFNSYYSDNSCFSASDTENATVSDKYEGCYNYLDKFNIKGCASLSGMMRLQAPLDGGNTSFKYLYFPIIKFLSLVAPHALISSEPGYKRSEYITNICKYDKFRNNNGVKFKCISELIKATITLDCNIDYLPKDIPLLFIHSIDDRVCNYKGSAMFYDKAKVNRKELYIVENMNHSITTGPGSEETLKAVIDWICDLERSGREEIKNEMEDGMECEMEGGMECEMEGGMECEMEGGMECEMEGGVEGEMEGGVEGEMEGGMEGEMEDGMECEMEGGVEGEMDGEKECEMEGGVEYEMEGEKEGEMDGEKECEMEDGIEYEMEGEIDDEKKLHIVDDMSHNITKDLENEHILTRIISWIRNLISNGEGEIEDEKNDEKEDEIKYEIEDEIKDEKENEIKGENEIKYEIEDEMENAR
ncbi:lysophospholipase, putative [Plasmodium chabaudi adami]|uniref:Lysophospholipase, putative n=1 Tax=Plasmodium chabaudi adami TaxID=5826 RepID=A0A1C6XIE6_PLACE|nr:lysophospholipase, putative [Plasmodium chabaudi adami]